MQFLELALVGLVMMVVGWSIELARSVRRTFAHPEPNTPRGREALVAEALRQHRSAYALVWFDIALTIVLITTLVARVILGDQIDLQLFVNATATAAAILLGYYANRLLRRTGALVRSLTAGH